MICRSAKHDKMKKIKEARIISAFHSSGISGVDHPLKDDTVYYKKNLEKIKQIVRRKETKQLLRHQNLEEKMSTSILKNNKTERSISGEFRIGGKKKIEPKQSINLFE